MKSKQITVKQCFERWDKAGNEDYDIISKELSSLLKKSTENELLELYNKLPTVFKKYTGKELSEVINKESLFRLIGLEIYATKYKNEIPSPESRKFALPFYPDIDKNEVILGWDVLKKYIWKIPELSQIQEKLDHQITIKFRQLKGFKRIDYFNFQKRKYQNSESYELRLRAWKDLLVSEKSKSPSTNANIEGCLSIIDNEILELERPPFKIEKINASLSGQQLAYLFGLLKRSKILTSEDSQLLKFLSANTTCRGKSLKWTSLKNDYYNPSIKIREDIEDNLQELIKLLHEERKKFLK